MLEGQAKYDSYKDSGIPWIGEVPCDWLWERGKWHHRHKKRLNSDGANDNVLSLTLRGVVNNDPDNPEGLVPNDYRTYQLFDRGDLVFKLIDLENVRTSRVGLVHESGIMSSAYIRVVPSRQSNSRFLYYFYYALYQAEVFNKLGAGVRSTLNQHDLLDLPVPVIDLDTQNRIVKFLDEKTAEIDAAVGKKRRLIDLLNEQKAILFDRKLAGLDAQILIENESRFFPKTGQSFELITLRRLVTKVADGPHFSPNYVDEGVIFISAGNVRSDRFLLDDVKYVSERDAKDFDKRIIPTLGDVLYTKGGTTGVAKVVDIDTRFQVWVHIAVLKVRKQIVLPDFLAYALNSSGCYIQSQLFTRGATNKDLGLTRMVNIELPLPPLDEQQVIVDWIDQKVIEFNSAHDKITEEITTLNEFKQTLIANAVTGKIKI